MKPAPKITAVYFIKPVNFNYIISILVLMALTRCTQSGQTSEQADSTQFQIPSSFIQRFKGTVDMYPITVTLFKKDSLIEGEYYYDNMQLPMRLRGSISDKTFSIQELNDKYEPSAEFSGSFVTINKMQGTWTNLSNQKKLLFELTENHDGVAQVQVQDYENQKCVVMDQDLKAIYNQDSLCNRVALSVISITTADPKVSKAINEAIVAAICETSIGDTSFGTIKELLQYASQPDAGGISIDVGCDLKTNDNNVLSVRISEMTFSYGAAHPNSSSKFYNFDLKTGALIQLEDILLPGYQEKLNVIGEKYFVKENGGEGWNFEPGSFELNKDFSISLTGLEFSFDNYELGAYVMGAPSVTIPYKDIKALISPTGVIANRKAK